jgi:hypothetical protein
MPGYSSPSRQSAKETLAFMILHLTRRNMEITIRKLSHEIDGNNVTGRKS